MIFPQLLKRTACIYVVTSISEGSFNPLGAQGGVASIPPSTPTGRTVELHVLQNG